jgi:NAD-dependent dihydropyrimidine dehydrogenase PreA subunit
MEAITVDDIAKIDPDTCTDCGTCVDECPNEAISLQD